jgi:hypothetical protein
VYKRKLRHKRPAPIRAVAIFDGTLASCAAAEDQGRGSTDRERRTLGACSDRGCTPGSAAPSPGSAARSHCRGAARRCGERAAGGADGAPGELRARDIGAIQHPCAPRAAGVHRRRGALARGSGGPGLRAAPDLHGDAARRARAAEAVGPRAGAESSGALVHLCAQLLLRLSCICGPLTQHLRPAAPAVSARPTPKPPPPLRAHPFLARLFPSGVAQERAGRGARRARGRGRARLTAAGAAAPRCPRGRMARRAPACLPQGLRARAAAAPSRRRPQPRAPPRRTPPATAAPRAPTPESTPPSPARPAARTAGPRALSALRALREAGSARLTSSSAACLLLPRGLRGLHSGERRARGRGGGGGGGACR